MMDWHETKLFVERATALSMDALHLLAGAILFLLLALLMRRSIADRWPWLGLLGVALLNEAADLWVERWPSTGMQFGEATKDVVLTMLVPTILLVAVRYFPRLFPAQLPHAAEPPE